MFCCSIFYVAHFEEEVALRERLTNILATVIKDGKCMSKL